MYRDQKVSMFPLSFRLWMLLFRSLKVRVIGAGAEFAEAVRELRVLPGGPRGQQKGDDANGSCSQVKPVKLWKTRISMEFMGTKHFFWVDKLDVTPAGWWLLLTPLKNDGLSNSWDDYSIPNSYGKSFKIP